MRKSKNKENGEICFKCEIKLWYGKPALILTIVIECLRYFKVRYKPKIPYAKKIFFSNILFSVSIFALHWRCMTIRNVKFILIRNSEFVLARQNFST